MTRRTSGSAVARRSFLSRLGAGAAAFGGAFAAGAVPVQAQAPPGGPEWAPARHAEDDWMDELTGVHRFVFDNVSASGFESALLYSNNFIDVNRNAYGLENRDLAVIVVARHNSTPFSFNDAMWARYGETFARLAGIEDRRNIHGPRLEGLFAKGLHLAVCGVASRRFATVAAEAVGADADEVYEEIAGNLLPNSHMTAAGIVAVNRAQERGYSFSFSA